jgi:hypothetical protein
VRCKRDDWIEGDERSLGHGFEVSMSDMELRMTGIYLELSVK